MEQHLNSQLRLLPLTAEQRKITHYITGNLTEAGYFELPLIHVANELHLPLEHIEQSLTLAQSLEPAGVAAQSLEQCLLLQLERLPDEAQWAKVLAQQYLVMLAEGKFSRIALQLGITVLEVEQAYETIRSLQPKPGLAFGHIERQPLIPDADIQLTEIGIEIVPNEALIPRIQLHAEARQWLKSKDRDLQQYVKVQQQVSDQLVKGLEQRKHTIQLVLERLAQVQQAFFLHGPGHMQPLTMRQLAADLGVHESTISRAIRHKVIRSPHGLVTLKQFFVSSLPGAGGIGISSEKIKVTIAQWISEEDRSAPLSDQRISDRLAVEGIFVSRRTVMKYREEQRILSSRLRKKRS